MQSLDTLISNKFPIHPFSNIPRDANYKTIMSNYLAMSQAFPYLQAGSQDAIFLHYMNQNQDIPEHVEMTTVVGNFLCWDETGGLYLTLANGLKGLPRLLETRRFHSNLLKKDCAAIFGDQLNPDYSATTKSYLLKLYEGLSSLSPVRRVAYMVSFESHANNMISALWESIAQKFNTEKTHLSYFQTHVGGDDPAEAYHVQMTNNLIAKIVPDDQHESFLAQFIEGYALNVQWCHDIIQLSHTGV